VPALWRFDAMYNTALYTLLTLRSDQI